MLSGGGAVRTVQAMAILDSAEGIGSSLLPLTLLILFLLFLTSPYGL